MPTREVLCDARCMRRCGLYEHGKSELHVDVCFECPGRIDLRGVVWFWCDMLFSRCGVTFACVCFAG